MIAVLMIASVTTVSAALYKGITQSWQYDEQKVFYSGPTIDWLKDFVEGSIAYS